MCTLSNKIRSIGRLLVTIAMVLFVAFVLVLVSWLIAKGFRLDIRINDVILFATLVAILYYSLETHLLKNATNIANAIQAEPLPVLKHRRVDNGNECYIINYGKGIAFNIEIGVGGSENKQRLSDSLGHKEECELPATIIDQILNTKISSVATVCVYYDKLAGDNLVSLKRKYEIYSFVGSYFIKLLG